MKIENVDIELLIPDPNNANSHNEKNLAAIRGSIKQFDVVEPLVVRRQNNVVVGGNGRLVVLKELGYKTVPVHYVDFDDQKAKALALALNRTSELSEWNMDVLGATLQELNEFDFDIGEIGFDLGEFNLDEPEGNEGDGDGESKGSMSIKFGIPPFTVFNAREGWWQERKRSWLALGIKSELGRGGGLR